MSQWHPFALVGKRTIAYSHRTCISAWCRVKIENLYTRWLAPKGLDEVTWFRSLAAHDGLRLNIQMCRTRRPAGQRSRVTVSYSQLPEFRNWISPNKVHYIHIPVSVSRTKPQLIRLYILVPLHGPRRKMTPHSSLTTLRKLSINEMLQWTTLA